MWNKNSKNVPQLLMELKKAQTVKFVLHLLNGRGSKRGSKSCFLSLFMTYFVLFGQNDRIIRVFSVNLQIWVFNKHFYKSEFDYKTS